MQNIENFKKLIEQGVVKDKWYFFKRTEEQKQQSIIYLKQLESFFKQKLDLSLYLTFGTLLGAIREKDFISHDNDIDVCYLSKYTKKEDILKEFKEICTTLQNHNMLSKIPTNGQIHAFTLDIKYKFDVWTSYVSNNYYFSTPYIKNILASSVVPLKPIQFRNEEFMVPNNPEKVLNAIYKDWQNPTYLHWAKQNGKNHLQ